MTSRIHCGFHRIGVVLAVPVLLVAGALAGHEAWLQQTTKDPYAGFADATPAPKKAPNYFDRFDPPSDAKPGMFDDLIPKTPYYRADYTMASLALALALALYAAARAVGWVLAGFIGGDRGTEP